MILITAVTTAQAHKLKNELNLKDVILGDYMKLPAFMLKADLIKLPSPKSTSYAHEMLTLCLDMSIEKVFVLRNEEYLLLAEAKQLFAEYGILLVHGS